MLHTSAISPALNPLPPVRTVIIPAKIIYSTFLPRSVSLRGSRSNISLPKRCEKKRLLPGKKSSITCGAGGAVREIDESQFSEVVLKSELPVLVEFVATWCGPCRLIAPAVQSLAQEYQDKLTVVKIDHDSNPRLIEEYKVYGLPTLILFQNGQEVSESRREGAITKAKLKDYVDKLLESVSVA